MAKGMRGGFGGGSKKGGAGNMQKCFRPREFKHSFNKKWKY